MKITVTDQSPQGIAQMREIDLTPENLLQFCSGISEGAALRSLLRHPATALYAYQLAHDHLHHELKFLEGQESFSIARSARPLNSEIERQLIDKNSVTIAVGVPYYTPGMPLAAIEVARRKLQGQDCCNIVFFPVFDQESYQLLSSTSGRPGIQVNRGYLIDQEGQIHFGIFNQLPIADWLDYSMVTGRDAQAVQLSGAKLLAGHYEHAPSGSKGATLQKLLDAGVACARTIALTEEDLVDGTAGILKCLHSSNEFEVTENLVAKPGRGSGGLGVSYHSASALEEIFDAAVVLLRNDDEVVIQERLRCAPLTLEGFDECDWNLRVIGGPTGLLLTEARVNSHGLVINKSKGATVFEAQEIIDQAQWDTPAGALDHTQFFSNLRDLSDQVRHVLGIEVVALDVMALADGSMKLFETNRGCFGGFPTLAKLRLQNGNPLSAVAPLVDCLSALAPLSGDVKERVALSEKLFDPDYSHPIQVSSYIHMQLANSHHSAEGRYRIDALREEISQNKWNLPPRRFANLNAVLGAAYKFVDDEGMAATLRQNALSGWSTDPHSFSGEKLAAIAHLWNEEHEALEALINESGEIPGLSKKATHQLRLALLLDRQDRVGFDALLDDPLAEYLEDAMKLYYHACFAYEGDDSARLQTVVNSMEQLFMHDPRDFTAQVVFARCVVGLLSMNGQNNEAINIHTVEKHENSSELISLAQRAYAAAVRASDARKVGLTPQLPTEMLVKALQELTCFLEPENANPARMALLTGEASRETRAMIEAFRRYAP